MPISIINVVLSTQIFIAIFVIALLVSIRRKEKAETFPLTVTQELKGIAIFAVIFSHVGYFLSTDHGFLFPLSILAGVGVNLFFFLSGYGLTQRALKAKLSIAKFYQKRLLKLFTPFWIVIVILFLLDFFLLHITYSWPYNIRSVFGLFPSADLFHDINSPFWFITPILFYYIIFPFVFSKKRPWLTAIVVFLVSYIVLQFKLPVTSGVSHLYQLHSWAFPLGIAFASLIHWFASSAAQSLWRNLEQVAWMKKGANKYKVLKRVGYYTILLVLLGVIAFTAYHSGVGASVNKEQIISLLTMFALILFFIMKRFEIKFFYLFGFYSFEIYLIHWPLMSRYDIFFKWLPGWLAVILYLGIFLFFAWVLKYLESLISRSASSKK
ncbi:MAG: hypothetical protein UT32_C0004G0015 [Parcubacteria group bacterium GW2011_GWC2_39_14]|nr:MAG: hypothetical protein UT32_C0004G0015 [Parcubacteria group bacterium GW2011_GWC2_39_14]KKR54859.1 MAG: hypothetical protein UT91_C0008G0015 [Parcubacteria group bacterium GW2011_GWA2_40_23]